MKRYFICTVFCSHVAACARVSSHSNFLLRAAFCISNLFPILCFQFALFPFVDTFYISYSVLKKFSGQGEFILLFY